MHCIAKRFTARVDCLSVNCVTEFRAALMLENVVCVTDVIQSSYFVDELSNSSCAVHVL